MTRSRDEEAGEFTYTYPRPAVTVDCVVFGFDLEEDHLKILLIQRDLDPHAGMWALPGGFVRADESLQEAAARELVEEASVRDVFLEQLYTFGDAERDPRGRVISVAYYALVKWSEHVAQAATDARDAAWVPIDQLPALAFDHEHIVEVALERLRGKVRYQPVGFELLPERFTMSQLQRLYETILETRLDRRNFQRKVRRMGIVVPTGESQQNVAHRAAKFYTFDREKYRELERDGFEFAL